MAETNFQKMIRALVTPLTTAETTLQQLYTERWVNTAVGAQLDIVGALVGRARQGVTDDEIYRRYIRATVAANKSDGLVSDLIDVSRLVVFDDAATYVVQYGGNASVHVTVSGAVVDPAVSAVLATLLRSAAAGGVRLVVETWSEDEADMFAFDGGTGLGFASLPELDLAPLTTNVETIVRYRDSVSEATLALVADGTGTGSLTNVSDAWTFHFQSGVTTVANFETAIGASTHLVVRSSDGVGTMAAGDVLAATALVAAEPGGALASAMT